jgi:hypothetical protein
MQMAIVRGRRSFSSRRFQDERREVDPAERLQIAASMRPRKACRLGGSTDGPHELLGIRCDDIVKDLFAPGLPAVRFSP